MTKDPPVSAPRSDVTRRRGLEMARSAARSRVAREWRERAVRCDDARVDALGGEFTVFADDYYYFLENGAWGEVIGEPTEPRKQK